MAQKKGPLTSPAYRKALAACRGCRAREGIDAAMTKHRLDAIVAPTGSPAWPIDPVNGDHFLGASSTPAAVAGYPNITVPPGFAHGLPVGISFIGAPWTEAKLIVARVRLRAGDETPPSAGVSSDLEAVRQRDGTDLAPRCVLGSAAG